MTLTLLQWFIIAVGLCITCGNLLSLSHHPHWFVRMWDFLRVHSAVLAVLSGASYAVFFSTWQWDEWLFVVALVACVIWQGYKIFPYTPLTPVQVKGARAAADASSFRLLITNVCMQNRQADRLLQVVRAIDPDLIVALEIDDWWCEQLGVLKTTYPYAVEQPQDNMYGILLFSRLRLLNPQVRFLVQDDIPSLHTWVELRNGVRFFLHGLHPRPPEPIRDQNATPRDTELVLVGHEIGQDEWPTVVAGDLNDVAWLHMTELFLRLSRLIDPRIGRGLYNTYNANYPFFHYPLDHVFHSACFTLVALRRLGYVGSDHFPICIELQYEPEAQAAQPEPLLESEQARDAQQKIDRASTEEGPLTETPRRG